MQAQWWSETTGTQLIMLGLALVCSAVIGLERQFRQKNAGMRTHVLVAFGAATFTLISAYRFAQVRGPHVTLDPTQYAGDAAGHRPCRRAGCPPRCAGNPGRAGHQRLADLHPHHPIRHHTAGPGRVELSRWAASLGAGVCAQPDPGVRSVSDESGEDRDDTV